MLVHLASWPIIESMGAYLNTAKKMYQMALAELQQWKHARDKVVLQEAAEKAWGAITQASNELIKAYGRPVPHRTNARRRALSALEEQHRALETLRLPDTFAAAEYMLRNGCFYEGNCSPEELVHMIRVRTKQFLETVEQASKR